MKLFKNLIKGIAPTIASALGTPLAGMATRAVLDAVWPGDPSKTEDDLETALERGELTSEQLVAIKKADQDFKIRNKEIDFDTLQLDYLDADSARKREMKVKDKMPAALAILLFLLFGAAMTAMFYVEIPEANKPIVFSMIGSLGTMTVAAAAYYHGSSRGSARKTEIEAARQTR